MCFFEKEKCYICNLALMRGFKCIDNDIFEKNCTIKTTNTCDKDRQKEGSRSIIAISGPLIPDVYLSI